MEPKTDVIYFQSKTYPEFRFLSNFHVAPFEIYGKKYPTVEHYYQAAKATNTDDFNHILASPTPGEARRRGQAIKLPQLWESMKIGVMEAAVRAKFTQNPDLGIMLRETAGFELVEYAPWGDTFWGVGKDYEGNNHLGKILMRIRDELLEEK